MYFMTHIINAMDTERVEAFLGRYVPDALAKFQRNPTTLNLGYNNIGADGARVIVEALARNRTLTELDLRFNNIGDAGAGALVEALAGNTTLTTLILWGNHIGDEGASALAAALDGNTTLTTLYLGDNNIGDDGARAIAKTLAGNTTLTELYLWRNYIGDAGVSALAAALAGNTTITHLNLWNNNIGDEGVRALADALAENTTITHLELMGNDIDAAAMAPINELLKRNRILAESKFLQTIEIIARSPKDAIFSHDVWKIIASYLGLPEEFIETNFNDIFVKGNASRLNQAELVTLAALVKENLNKRALALGIRSSKMSAGKTEEDLTDVSNDETLASKRLRALYEKESDAVKREFTFHRWLKMQSSFYDAEQRKGEKKSFEEWLDKSKGEALLDTLPPELKERYAAERRDYYNRPNPERLEPFFDVFKRQHPEYFGGE